MRSPFSFTAGPLPPVVACTSSDGKPWRALPSHMDTRTPPDDQVPAWIADAALRQHHVVSKDSKCAFNLLAERVRRASAVVLLDLASSPWHQVAGHPLLELGLCIEPSFFPSHVVQPDVQLPNITNVNAQTLNLRPRPEICPPAVLPWHRSC